MNNEDKLGWAFYMRTSPREKETLESQRMALVKFANKNHFPVDKEFIDEKVSANKSNIRPQFSKMLEQIEIGEVNKIICLYKEKLSENYRDSYTLENLLWQEKLKEIRYVTVKKRKTANRENGS